MIEEYTVVKPFSRLHIADTLNYNKDTDSYEFNRVKSHSDEYTDWSMSIDVSYSRHAMDELCNNGFVRATKFSDASNKVEKLQNKIDELRNFVDVMTEEYQNRMDEVNKDYNEGKVQTCVKVESETVHYNLIKVLREIKSILDK